MAVEDRGPVVARNSAPLALGLLTASTIACSTIDEGGTSTTAASGPFIGVSGVDDDDGDAGVDEGGRGLGPVDFDDCFPGPEGTEPDSTALHHVRSCQ
jgi:hypothetical protein